MIGTIGAVIIIAIGAAICWGMYQVICDMDNADHYQRLAMQYALEQAYVDGYVESVAKVERMRLDREHAKDLNTRLWAVIADYRAGVITLEDAERACDSERYALLRTA